MRAFFDGVRDLGHGVSWWRRRPGLMAWGLAPAAIVGLALTAALAAWAFALPSLTVTLSPWAEQWPAVWSTILRVALGTAMFGAAVLLVVVTFTALALIAGEPAYDRIWRAVETEIHGAVPEEPYGFWRATRDALGLLARGLLAALVAALLGLIPLVGAALSAVIGLGLTAWLLADELTSRALTARGLSRSDRRALLGRHRARALGFGVATQLCFLIPLGAVLVMPVAVAGSTGLASAILSDDVDA